MRVPFVLVALVSVGGCPPSERASGSAADGAPAGGAACARVGQSCEVSPGKLGTCVALDDCRKTDGCFVCQSQH